MYVAKMETMLPSAAAQGIAIPEATIVSQVHRYLDLIEAKILMRGDNPSRGRSGANPIILP
jgi:hypothetical protein